MNRQLTYLEAIREALCEQLTADETVFLIGEDIGVYGGSFRVTEGLLAKFGPERVRDTPISELGFVGIAVGAAMTGMKPIVDIQFSDFLTLPMDQIVNQAAKTHFMYGGQHNVPLVIRTPSGSGTGAASQHSQSLEAWFTHIPGLKVVQPSTAYDAKGLLHTAINDANPVIFFEHKLLYDTVSDVPEKPYYLPFGVADVKREGTDVTVVATGVMVAKAVEAAAVVKDRISVEVIDPRTLIPLDIQTIIQSVQKTGRLLVVHEAAKSGGFGGEIISQVVEKAFSHLKEAPICLAGKDVPIPNNPTLEKAVIPQVETIVQKLNQFHLS